MELVSYLLVIISNDRKVILAVDVFLKLVLLPYICHVGIIG